MILWFGFALKLMKVISIRDCKRTAEREIQKPNVKCYLIKEYHSNRVCVLNLSEWQRAVANTLSVRLWGNGHLHC